MSTPVFYMVKAAGRGTADHYFEKLSDAESMAQRLAQKDIGTVYVVLSPLSAFRAASIQLEKVPIDKPEAPPPVIEASPVIEAVG